MIYISIHKKQPSCLLPRGMSRESRYLVSFFFLNYRSSTKSEVLQQFIWQYSRLHLPTVLVLISLNSKHKIFYKSYVLCIYVLWEIKGAQNRMIKDIKFSWIFLVTDFVTDLRRTDTIMWYYKAEKSGFSSTKLRQYHSIKENTLTFPPKSVTYMHIEWI